MLRRSTRRRPGTAKQRDAPEADERVRYDVLDAPDDELARVDLGALRIPVGDDFDVRVDINETQQVMSATLAGPDGTMQLGVFAAPRNEGIWDEVREEIAASLNSQRKGSATEKDGRFGTELHGTVPDESGRGTVPVRFLGVDGPRWFLRAMLAGAVATDEIKASVFERRVAERGRDPGHRSAAGARTGAAAAARRRRAAADRIAGVPG